MPAGILHRAVRYLAGEVGIRQFLDVGPGLPTRNTHHVVPALRGQQREQIAAALAQRFIQEQVSIRDLASELGRRLSLVRRLLDEAAVCAETTSCVGVPKSEVAAVLAARYREGVPTERLSDDTGIDRRVVRRMLTGEGVSPPERHPLSVETGYYHD